MGQAAGKRKRTAKPKRQRDEDEEEVKRSGPKYDWTTELFEAIRPRFRMTHGTSVKTIVQFLRDAHQLALYPCVKV